MSSSLCAPSPIATNFCPSAAPNDNAQLLFAAHGFGREEYRDGGTRPLPESGRVLCVDDCPTFRSYYAAALRRLNVMPDFASDAFEALNIIEKSPMPYSLVITDHAMPGMSGLQLATELRCRSFTGWICMSSSLTPQEIFREVTAIPLDVFFPKPMRVKDLKLVLTVCGIFHESATGAPLLASG